MEDFRNCGEILGNSLSEKVSQCGLHDLDILEYRCGDCCLKYHTIHLFVIGRQDIYVANVWKSSFIIFRIACVCCSKLNPIALQMFRPLFRG